MQQKRSGSVMGAAETRVLWQRMASRCCVQEDAKRAPKLACWQHQSSSFASPKHIALEPSSDTLSDEGFEDASYCSDFAATTKWWLKGSMGQQLDSFQEQLECLKPEFMNSLFEDNHKCKRMQEFADLMSRREDNSFKERGDSGKSNEMYYEYEAKESPWEPSKKPAPWWRTTADKDDLALLVATKSLDHLQNCDLPPPQNVHHKLHCFDCLSGSPLCDTGCLKSLRTPWKPKLSGEVENVKHRCEESSSYSSAESKNMSHKSVGKDLNKAELLEALRHSQTRARKAEEAAEEAYREKEHIVTLLFRQASQMFAYKQWFQLLELEGMYLKMKNNEKEMKGRNMRKKRWKRMEKGEMGRYVFAFALGFSLIGAGLLLGWTVGWLFPF